MNKQPSLRTERLILRPFGLSDANDVRRLAGERAIASVTLNIPYPYEEGMAEEWISGHQESFEKRETANFAIVRIEKEILIGAIGLMLTQEDQRAELGYWIGRPYWNNGYCTEAAKTVLRYGFIRLNLNKIHASHFKRNSASGRVMRKIGMSHEGCQKQHVKKWEFFQDLELYGILRRDYQAEQFSKKTDKDNS
ncbi:GNAT family N-acetyltransferase [Desulfonema magnum]|uniref:GNAT domain-containing protein n=1 Tax=Desulfonema magnum TaxID=45655 RepID=A0A975BQM0_9BACT|nr:GNAT family N-acetyltransferase [Desulfonema magnum]QTA89765.1 GNAT domain-containing protein [Desulfonema magnum]